MEAAVFLDRDGVLNPLIEEEGGHRSPRTAEEFELDDGAARIVAELREAGYRVFIVTNQPDLARGKLPLEELRVMNSRIRARLGVDDLRVCPHDDADECECRKPAPGMLHVLAKRWGVDLSASYMVGDTWRDVDAGRAAGCTTILIRRPYNIDVEADHVADTLEEAAALILERASAHV